MSYKDGLSAVEDLYNQPNVTYPKPEESRKMAEGFSTRTVFGNYNFVPTVKNRSAGLTLYISSQKVTQCNLNQRQREILKC